MKQARSVAAFILAFALVLRADDTVPPQTEFENCGLSVSDSWLVLPFESGFHDRVGQVKHSADAVHAETISRRDLRFEIQGDRRNLDGLTDKLLVDDNQLNQYITQSRSLSKDDPAYSQIVDLYNAAAELHNSLTANIDSQQKDLDNATAKLGQVPDSRAAYTNLVMDVAGQGESIARAYATLAQDRSLTQAITTANLNTQPPLKLGPTPDFAADLDFLRKGVTDVVDSPVPVRRDPSNDELYVQAVINGSVTDEMMWDSGADQVAISTNTAKQLGIHFTDQDPTFEVGTAGTDTVKVHQATLKSIRLGGFTVRNVTCIVLPDGLSGHIDDLLGDTFQTHFISRMDQVTRQLQLTPADSSVLVGAIPHELSGADK
jgi:clan AA aspartic protease (TIGR02281 family)